MTEQIFAARNLIGRRGFSSASAHCGLGRQRTYVASIRHPVRNRYGTHNFSSRSLVNLGGDRRISYGGYGAGSYGVFSYSPAGYGSLGFSDRLAHCGPRIGSGRLFGGYSNSRGDGIQGVRINENLLKPLHVGVDPEEQEIRNREREEMKNLNNQFASFIDKVQSLEQQNKVLETKWNLLQEYARPARKNLEPYYENFIILIKNQIDCLLNEREQLENENDAIQHLVEEFKCKYEEEFKQRTTAENEFVLLKKDVDSISLSKEGLQGKADLLRRELEFRGHVYAEEFAQLGGQVCDAKILLQMDNSRVMDADLIIRNIEAWYQNIVQKTKEEVNALYENRFKELQLQRGKHSDILKINQQAVTQLVRLIHKMQSENDIVKRQVNALETDICDVEQRGDHALKDARQKHINLQTALKKAKDDLAGLLKDYHEVLNVKMALDIEIATYRTMLEGEEIRIHTGNPAHIDVVRPLYLDNLVGGGPVGLGYNSGYGGYPRNCNRHSSSRSVGEPSRTVDNSNVTTRPGSSDVGRSCPVDNPGADSSSQDGGAGVGKDGRQGLGFSSGTVQGSINNVSRGYVPGGIEQSCPSGGYLSGGYRPANIVPAQAGGFGPRVGGTPIVVDSNPGVAGGIAVGNIGGPAIGIPVAVGYGGLGGRPCVETGAPVGICYPGVQRAPGGVYYPGQVGAPGGIFYTEAVAMM